MDASASARRPLAPAPPSLAQPKAPRVGAIPLSGPSRLPAQSAVRKLDTFRRPAPTLLPPRAAEETGRGYKDLGQGSLIQRHSGLKASPSSHSPSFACFPNPTLAHLSCFSS